MISGKTSLVCLLGDPVSHSLSPSIQNAALKELGLDWCYLAMPCESQNFKMITSALRKINCKGINITIPHKETAIKSCNKISPLAAKLKAINTLVPNEQEGWTGHNTDVEGFLAPLKQRKWQGDHALVLGSGGSSRAIIAGLQTLKLKKITMVGRKIELLNNVLKDLSTKDNNILNGILDSDKDLTNYIKNADLIVNATPVGMSHEKKDKLQSNPMPFGADKWQYLTQKTTIYDLIYTPRPTHWLSYGAKQGCQAIDGLEMLICQAAASLKLWSGIEEIPINAMRIEAEKLLKN